jgi:hypothetical protein
MESPKLDSDPIIDDIIIKCWHNRYATLKELAAYTECRTKEATSQKKLIAKYRIAIAMASVNKAQQRIFLSKRDPAKTWTGASSYAFFGRNLDSVSSCIDIPKIEAKALDNPPRSIPPLRFLGFLHCEILETSPVSHSSTAFLGAVMEFLGLACLGL